MYRLRFLPAFLLLALSVAGTAGAPDLKPHTLEAFLHYARITEANFLEEVTSADTFLQLDLLSADDERDAREELQRGEAYIKELETLDEDGQEIEVKNGIIHHWYGVVFVPGTNLEETLALVQDYRRHSDIYFPDVVKSSAERDGDQFEVEYRFRKQKLITVTLDTWHDVRYFQPSPDRAYSISKTTKVQEVENADEEDEARKPPDVGQGFMWRINSYWRFLESPDDDGIYIECTSISLTRDIPLLFRPIISPFVKDMPKELLTDTLQSTLEVLSGAPLPGGVASAYDGF